MGFQSNIVALLALESLSVSISAFSLPIQRSTRLPLTTVRANTSGDGTPATSTRVQENDVVIIGGGLAGLSTALYLSEVDSTRQITILEREDCSQTKTAVASFAAAGMLAPQSERLPSGPLLDLCIASRRLYPEFVELVETKAASSGEQGKKYLTYGDGTVGYLASGGFLAPAFAGDTVATWAPPEQSGSATWLDNVQVRELEPSLHPNVVGGWWFPEDASVDARRLTCSLRAACTAAGVKVQTGKEYEVKSLDLVDGHCNGVWTENGKYIKTKAVLVANGAWMRTLLPVPIEPHKGQSISLRMPSDRPPILQRVLFAQDTYICPKADGRIVVGATVEVGSFDSNITPAGMIHIIQHALELVPGLKDLPIEETWAGLRPTTPDKGPILGRTNWDNLFLAGGYWRNGVLLAPKTGQLLASLIAGKELSAADNALLNAFSWDRFTSREGAAKLAASTRYAASMHPVQRRSQGFGVAAAVGTELGSYSSARSSREERQQDRSAFFENGDADLERAAQLGILDGAAFNMGDYAATMQTSTGPLTVEKETPTNDLLGNQERLMLFGSRVAEKAPITTGATNLYGVSLDSSRFEEKKVPMNAWPASQYLASLQAPVSNEPEGKADSCPVEGTSLFSETYYEQLVEQRTVMEIKEEVTRLSLAEELEIMRMNDDTLDSTSNEAESSVLRNQEWRQQGDMDDLYSKGDPRLHQSAQLGLKVETSIEMDDFPQEKLSYATYRRNLELSNAEKEVTMSAWSTGQSLDRYPKTDTDVDISRSSLADESDFMRRMNGDSDDTYDDVLNKQALEEFDIVEDDILGSLADELDALRSRGEQKDGDSSGTFGKADSNVLNRRQNEPQLSTFVSLLEQNNASESQVLKSLFGNIQEGNGIHQVMKPASNVPPFAQVASYATLLMKDDASDLNQLYDSINKNKAAFVEMGVSKEEERPDPGFRIFFVDNDGERHEVPPFTSPEEMTRIVAAKKGPQAVFVDPQVITENYSEQTFDGYTTIQQANSRSSRQEELEAMKDVRRKNRFGGADMVDESKIGAQRMDFESL